MSPNPYRLYGELSWPETPMVEDKTRKVIKTASHEDLAVNLLVFLEIISFTDGIKSPED